MAELTRAQASEKMQNIVEGSENVSLKFGVLIGLIKVESVSNKEVVNTILHLVSTKPDPVAYWRDRELIFRNNKKKSVGEEREQKLFFLPSSSSSTFSNLFDFSRSTVIFRLDNAA